ncbi:MAG: hypothetical protein V8R80_10850 [Eubacterium sp.]
MTGTYTITAGVADQAGKEDASLATISAVNAETEDAVILPAKAEEGTSITFKATVTNDSVNMVRNGRSVPIRELHSGQRRVPAVPIPLHFTMSDRIP